MASPARTLWPAWKPRLRATDAADIRVLVVEDEAVTAMDIQASLREMGYVVSGAARSSDEALARARETQPSVVLMDVKIRGSLDGIETARALRADQDLPVVFLTGHADDVTVRRALETEPEGYLLKPFNARALAIAIELALQKHAMKQRLKRETVADALTGLFNRRHLEVSLEREVMLADRKREELSLLLMDLDHFKQVNDRHGHAMGDAALRAFAHLLQTSVRGYDIPCRYGGEEFAVVLPRTSAADAGALAERLRARVEQLVVDHEGTRLDAITVSIGVAALADACATAPLILAAADGALYRAKRDGRNRVAAAIA